MKKAALICLLLCLLITPTAVNANAGGPLSDIQQVRILIEDLDKAGLAIGLTEESLSDQVLIVLKRDIPKLRINDNANNILYVNVASIQDPTGISTFISVRADRYVEIHGDTGSRIPMATATVWDKGTILTGPTYGMASRIKDKISDFVSSFAAQYYKDNP